MFLDSFTAALLKCNNQPLRFQSYSAPQLAMLCNTQELY